MVNKLLEISRVEMKGVMTAIAVEDGMEMGSKDRGGKSGEGGTP